MVGKVDLGERKENFLWWGSEKKLLRDFGKSLDHEFDFSTNQIAGI